MRDALQNTWGKWVTGLIFGAIIFTFVIFFGPQSSGYAPGTKQWVARVDGIEISNQELIAAYDRYLRLTGNRGQRSEEEFADARRQQALARAAVELIAARAEVAGVRVTDDELRCFIVNWHRGYTLRGERICAAFPDDYAERYRNYEVGFFTDSGGKFTDDYPGAVRAEFQVSVEAYEARKRRELMARYYLDALAATVEPSPDEVARTHTRRATTVDLEYIRVDASTAAHAEPTPGAVQEWAAAHAEAIATRYAEDPAAFAVPGQVRVRRIYVRKPDAGSPEFAAAEQKFRSALSRAQAGEPFAALARELSELSSEAELGGDMGSRTVDSLASELWEAANQMSAAEIRAVEQEYGWNVVLLEEKSEPRTRPIDEVRDEIAAELLGAELQAAVAATVATRAQRVLALAADGRTLAEAAEAEALERAGGAEPPHPADGSAEGSGEATQPRVPALTVSTTGPFAIERPSQFAAMIAAQGGGIEFPPDPADAIPGIGSSRALVARAFALTSDAPLIPELIDVDGVPFALRLAARVEAPELDDATAGALHGELRGQLLSALIGDANTRAQLFLGLPGPLPVVVQELVDQALASGGIELRADFFSAPAADPVGEI